MSATVIAAVGAAVCAAAAAAQLDGMDGFLKRSRAAARTDTAAPSDRCAEGPHGTASATKGGAGSGVASAFRSGGRSRDVLVAVICGCVGLALAGPVPAAIGAAVAGGASAWKRQRAQAGAVAGRERAMPALARALSDALRGGASVRGAIDAAAQDRSVPTVLRVEAQALAHAVQVGAPLEAALVELAAKGGGGLRLLCGTVAMHLEAGGALAQVLVRLADEGEQAARIDEDRVAATAQARATVRVVAALPILALVGAELATGNFIGTIAASPAALALLILGFALEGAAILAARAIVGVS